MFLGDVSCGAVITMLTCHQCCCNVLGVPDWSTEFSCCSEKSQSHWPCGSTATAGVPHGNIKRLSPVKYVSFQPKLSIERIKSSVIERDTEIYK